MSEITRILDSLQSGDRGAVDRLFPMLYDELKRVAASRLKGERPGMTLQPTALVNEAYLRLLGQTETRFANRSHFMALCAVMMRRILLEHARGRGRKKRGEGVTPIEWTDDVAATEVDLDQLLDFDTALAALERLDARQARIVELRFFGGLSMPEVAGILGVSTRTAEGDWHMARAWLKRTLAEPAACP